MDFLDELASAIVEGRVTDRAGLERLKRHLAAGAGAARVPTDADILARLGEGAGPDAVRLLMTKPSRSLSGVAVVAVMAPPSPCPHGRCAYCPGGVEWGTPQSYTGREPAALRAERAGYDGARQTAERLKQLEGGGHATDKVELVLMGGTFPATPEPARSGFVRACLDVLNGGPSPSLAEAIELNEGALRRCVALTVETRPDMCDRRGVDELLGLGTTRVEIGVQTTEDRPLELVGRGHGLRESLEATRNLKDSGLKVGFHMMLGLPGMTPADDLRALRRTVEDTDLRPDLLKLYPTLVMPGTELHERWVEGEYEPIDEGSAVEVLADLKAGLPPWVRVSRIERDIPSPLIAAGVRASNLRQLVASRLEGRGQRCRCIRCREVGRRGTGGGDPHGVGPPRVTDLELREELYGASGGEEAFISLELPDDDSLVGYARVRRPSEAAWRPELDDAAILREVRLLGMALPLGAWPSDADGSLEWQHRGLGKRLLEEAEERARSWGLGRLAVTAGTGARGYFRRWGFDLQGPYMVSSLG